MKSLIPAIMIFTLFLISCEKQDNELVIQEFSFSVDKKTTELIKADNEFGLGLFRSLLMDGECPENVMISPVSVAIALGMTYNGAEGTTKTAFEATLKLKDFTREEINKIHFALVNYLLSADHQITLGIANSIWYEKLFNIQESFISTNKRYYNAEIRSLDFNDPLALKTINDWIASRTNQKVSNTLDRIPPDAVMYLINILYFNGLWKYAFDEKHSFYGDFYGGSNDLVVKYMKSRNSYNFFQNDLLSMVELPYGNGDFVMDILLPAKGKEIKDILEQFSPSNWEYWLEGLKKTENMIVQLPKFKYEYKTLLNESLCSMGLGEAFDSRADFSGINPYEDLFISRVIHQTFIDVNEKGTEAAGVTIVEVVKTTSGASIPSFIANRPFIYAIRETKTGALLFLGQTGIPQYI